MKADELLKNHQNFFVNFLCNYNDDGWSFPFFPEAKIVTPMLVHFVIMNSEELKNDIFCYKMQQLAKNITQESPLEEIFQTLWVPLFDHCCTVADELKRETITLSSLSNYFGSKESADSELTIKRLLSAVEKCQVQCTKDIVLVADLCIQTDDVSKLAAQIETKSLDVQWIKGLARRITDWSNVHELSNEADQFKETLDAYGLDAGSLVYHFSRQVILTKNHFSVIIFIGYSGLPATDT